MGFLLCVHRRVRPDRRERCGWAASGTSLATVKPATGYAIKGVEFSICPGCGYCPVLRVQENDSRTDSHVEILYAIDKTKGADFLKALGLENGLNRYTNADQLDSTKYYYQSDVVIDALAAALESNSTVVKNALEAYISTNGGAAMPLTDSYGKTKAENLNLGLYLVVETKVPEMVVSTTDPFLVSIPMTSVDGTNATDGGTRWIYDITLYPKNLTGIPSLEKTLRENQNDTGKHQVPLPASPTAMPTPAPRPQVTPSTTRSFPPCPPSPPKAPICPAIPLWIPCPKG